MSDNHNIGKLYKTILINDNYDAPVSDTKNSYATTSSISGPGHGPTGGARDSDSTPISANTRLMFPDEISNGEKLDLLRSFLKSEIDEGEWSPKIQSAFKSLLSVLL